MLKKSLLVNKQQINLNDAMKKLLYSILLLASIANSQVNVTYTVNTTTGQTSISPFIYGMCNGGYNQATIWRQGGNRMTGYNWENNASHAGVDWYNNNDDYLPWVSGIGSPQNEQPATVTKQYHEQALSNNAQSAITIPMAGYVAKDKNGEVTVGETAPSSRWCSIVNQKGSAFSLTPNTADNYVYSDEYLNFLITTYGNSTTATGIKNYILDNEPGLWKSTHPRIQPGNNNVASFMSKSLSLAQTIKNMDVNAKVFGPESFGFSEFLNFQDAEDWGSFSGTYPWFIAKYLDNFKTASTTAGHRLLDVLSVHWYPQNDGVNIFSQDTDAATVEARMQNPRMLWDTSFTTNSWIYTWFSSYMPILPYLKSQISSYYPNTKLGITEYDYGGDAHFSGGIAQAEALMAFIKTGTDYATKWGGFSDYSLKAIEIYNSVPFKFGNTAITSDSSNRSKSNVVASINGSSDSELHIIATNKDISNVINATFSITKNASTTYSSIMAYTISPSSPTITTQNLSSSIINSNGFSFSLQPATIYHFVLKTSPLSTNDSEFLSSVSVYPNPSNGEFVIENSDNIKSYEIADLTGKLISDKKLESSLNKIDVDLNKVSSGVYFLKIYDQNNNFKIVKILKSNG